MPPEAGRIHPLQLVLAGLRRPWWRTAAAVLVAALAAGAIFGAALLLTGGSRTLKSDLDRLGADMLVVPKGRAEEVRKLLTTGQAGPLPADISVGEWRKAIKAGKVVGVVSVKGWLLDREGPGEPAAGDKASILLVTLEHWASPLLAVQEVSSAIPGAEIVVAEQATRQVTRNLQPMVKLMTGGAAVALLGAVLMIGLLTSVRVGERRGELGMMRAIGATRRFLIGLTLGETLLPAVAGGLAGVVLGGLGLALSGSARSLVLRLSLGEILLYAVAALVALLAITAMSALGPALRAAHLDPLDAIRRGR